MITQYGCPLDLSIVVAAPAEEGRDFVKDLERYPEWSVSDSVEIHGGADEIGEGLRYLEIGRIGPEEIATESEIVEWDPPRR